MITLHGFGPNLGLADLSPFVLKVDAYLRVANIDFVREDDTMKNLRKSPKDKLPFIDDGGHIVADSQIIIDYLEAKAGDKALDQWLSEEQKAINWLTTKAMDDHLYWCGIHSRWACDDTWPTIREAFFGGMPFPLKKIVPFMVQRDMKRSLMAQGTGRHSDAEIQAFVRRTMTSLSVVLGDKDYFLGERMSTLDISAFAFLAQNILVDLDNPHVRIAREFANLVAYAERFHQQYYAVADQSISG